MTSSDNDDPSGLAPARGCLTAMAIGLLVYAVVITLLFFFHPGRAHVAALERPWRAIYVEGTGFTQIIAPDGTPVPPARCKVIIYGDRAFVYLRGRERPVEAALERVGASDGGIVLRAIPGFDGSTRITIRP